MHCIKYRSPRFSNISDEKLDMYIAPTLAYLKSVNVTNKTNENISINLKLTNTYADRPLDYYVISGRIIKPNTSENILAEGGIYEVLQTGEMLQCFSDGYSQVFDCSFYVEELLEANYWGKGWESKQ